MEAKRRTWARSKRRMRTGPWPSQRNRGWLVTQKMSAAVKKNQKPGPKRPDDALMPFGNAWAAISDRPSNRSFSQGRFFLFFRVTNLDRSSLCNLIRAQFVAFTNHHSTRLLATKRKGPRYMSIRSVKARLLVAFALTLIGSCVRPSPANAESAAILKVDETTEIDAMGNATVKSMISAPTVVYTNIKTTNPNVNLLLRKFGIGRGWAVLENADAKFNDVKNRVEITYACADSPASNRASAGVSRWQKKPHSNCSKRTIERPSFREPSTRRPASSTLSSGSSFRPAARI